MASYIEKVLLPDERIMYVAVIHWVIYLQGLVITAAGGLVGFFSHPLLVFLFGSKLGEQFARPFAILCMIVVIVGTALIAGAYIRQTSTEICITNKRLIAKYGFIARTTFEIMISRITGANFDQSVMARILGYGTVLVHGAGGEISPIDQVSHPQLFYRALVSVIERR